jgi:predicted RNA binding protein YcfA (HicA-like mRNA interferase family)
MPPLPILDSRRVIRALERAGFQYSRQRGSHVRLKHPDGQNVTVPVHAGKMVGRGLLRKILRDAELSVDDLLELLD